MIKFGKYKYCTFEDIYKEDREYCKWVLTLKEPLSKNIDSFQKWLSSTDIKYGDVNIKVIAFDYFKGTTYEEIINECFIMFIEYCILCIVIKDVDYVYTFDYTKDGVNREIVPNTYANKDKKIKIIYKPKKDASLWFLTAKQNTTLLKIEKELQTKRKNNMNHKTTIEGKLLIQCDTNVMLVNYYEKIYNGLKIFVNIDWNLGSTREDNVQGGIIIIYLTEDYNLLKYISSYLAYMINYNKEICYTLNSQIGTEPEYRFSDHLCKWKMYVNVVKLYKLLGDYCDRINEP